MGMAASQARYLALVARKSNCEYEGQQINQSRLILSNQSAELFNQMMTLEVPSPPSKTDFSSNQYSYKIGTTTYTIDKWDQLAASNSDGYNYVVTYHYNSNEYTGYQKYKTNPQVQFSGVVPSESSSSQIISIEDALKNIESCKKNLEDAENNYQTLLSQASKLTYYRDTSFNNLTKNSVEQLSDGSYSITRTDGGLSEQRVYVPYENLDSSTKSIVSNAINILQDYGALEKGYSLNNIYYDSLSKTMAFFSDIKAVGDGTTSILNTYNPGHKASEESEVPGILDVYDEIEAAKQEVQTCKSALDIAQTTYDLLDVPTYVGNSQLTPVSELDDNEVAAINQILKNMKEEGIETNIVKCFDTLEGVYNANNYIGGLYKFDVGNSSVYTTYYDLVNSVINGTGINNIDNQAKLPYYGAENMENPKTETAKAVVETDQTGRFISIRYEDDSIVHTLTAETTTDEIAYNDAMNQYNYEKSVYDKKIQDINAQTSIIQRQDQTLELRLKQLDTEQNALNTEIDAVSKVVKDNVEKSFKTFGG